jgi:hypothetical protein
MEFLVENLELGARSETVLGVLKLATDKFKKVI